MMEDEILTLNLSGDNEELLKAFLAHCKTFPGFATTNAKVQPDTRHGGFTTRYATVVIHK
jgi:hypothetical protein